MDEMDITVRRSHRLAQLRPEYSRDEETHRGSSMIRDTRQLKAKIQQLVKGDSQKSQIYLRNFFMERFLERISKSP